MKRTILSAILAFAVCGTARAADPVLATVNGEPIRLSRVREAPPGPEAKKTLDRMIGVELAIQEGYRMGLDETIEVRDQMGVFERDTLRDGLFAGRVGGLKPDPAKVDAMAKAMTVEVRLRSAAFDAEADAAKAAARAARGDDFDAAAKEAKGTLDPGEGFIRMSELLPSVQAALAPLSPGGVTPVYKIGEKFAVTRLIDKRDAPDPDARAKAEAEVLRRTQTEAIAKYAEELKKRDAKVDEKLYATIDFDAEKPGFDSYMKDKRTLVTIAGGAPITVHDLADAVRKRLFHGPEQAAGKHRLNKKKNEVLDDLITKRVVLKEAVAKGLDKKPEYLAVRRARERELVFGAFVAKAIEPEVKVSDLDVELYYESHRKDLTGPDMARIESMAFGSRKDAEAALAKLRSGADMAWMRVNAPGRLDPATNPDLLAFPAAPVILADMPEDLRQSLAKAASGEYRLHVSAGGPAYVIFVRELLPGRAMPLKDATPMIRSKLTGEKRQRVFDDYVATLRKAAQVKVLVPPDQLQKMVTAP